MSEQFKFEFDEKKSKANKEKHGIDFIEAQKMWLGLTLEIPARTVDEPRALVIGIIAGKLWSAVITRRSEQLIRLICVRRSRDYERKLYEKK